jgi:hypothetical protein
MIIICKSQSKTASELATSSANVLFSSNFKGNLVFKSFIPVS